MSTIFPDCHIDLNWITVCNKFCNCAVNAKYHIVLTFLSLVQYIPRNMYTVFALLCFVVVIHWLIFPYPSGSLHWHCGNLTIAPVPAKQPGWIWINTSCEFIMNDCITTTKQSTKKPCAYFLGYTVACWIIIFTNGSIHSLSKALCISTESGPHNGVYVMCVGGLAWEGTRHWKYKNWVMGNKQRYICIIYLPFMVPGTHMSEYL